MKKQEQAQKLAETGEYNTDTALARINHGKRGAERITKKQLLDKLRKAGFLAYGITAKPHDPIHNKPPKWVREKGWARIEKEQYIKKNTGGITGEYSIAIFSQSGMEIIEKILTAPSFSLQKYREQLEQQQKIENQPTPEEEKKQREKSEQSHNHFEKTFAEIFNDKKSA